MVIENLQRQRSEGRKGSIVGGESGRIDLNYIEE